MIQTANPVTRLPIKFAENVERGKFVNFAGKKCAAGQSAVGVTELAWNNGDEGTVVTTQTAIVKVKAKLNAGALITSDASGDGVLATEGDVVNGVLLKGCEANTLSEVYLTKYVVPPTSDHNIVLPASAKIEDNRFVQIAGGEVKHAGANGVAIGVVVEGVEQGADATISTCGVVQVVVGSGGVTENTYVTSDASGKAVAVANLSATATLTNAVIPAGATPVTSDAAQPTLTITQPTITLAGGVPPVKILGVALETKSENALVKIKLL